ncbi:RNA polymerase sigma factor [Herbiconiux sp. CPCC 203407]|uniref:RNA polymerase sigma factor n=1 Tax=Herbiconiux oxytropis TaxID=2970915 RepID=A0AA42BUZ3_9MICO|nr:RNA polymerase sigma factor [Herbiconiux oxytropis]MCS5723949.1 RNA polymerase sigma factor [Herbiconiux oxytropis]MCS5728045.1 RNA polymerase sigma factor [Herbiconiux oxytropis]
MTTTTTDDEAARWDSARAGDPESFGVIFDLHRNRVFHQAQRMSPTIHDAEDVTAATFLEAWRRRESVRVVDGSVIGWLLVTANYLARNLDRSRRRYGTLLEQMREPEHGADPADEVADRLDTHVMTVRVRDAFARLSKRDQDIITLCLVQQLSTADAATVLSVPLGTVKSRLSRAKQRLARDVLATLDSETAHTGGAR